MAGPGEALGRGEGPRGEGQTRVRQEEAVEAPAVLGLDSAFFSAGLEALPLVELDEPEEADEGDEGLSLADEPARESVR